MWGGLYVLKSALWAFILYHGVFLIPAIVLRRSCWLESWVWTPVRTITLLALCAIAFSGAALLLYEVMGSTLLSNDGVMDLLKELGFSKQLFWPLSIYLIVVNPLLEELFWRGVVLNELDDLKLPVKHFGIIWSSLTYALFHYLIFRLVLFPGFAELGIVMLALFGALLAVVYRKTGSIVTTALTHGLLTDLAAIVLILNLFRRYPGVL